PAVAAPGLLLPTLDQPLGPRLRRPAREADVDQRQRLLGVVGVQPERAETPEHLLAERHQPVERILPGELFVNAEDLADVRAPPADGRAPEGAPRAPPKRGAGGAAALLGRGPSFVAGGPPAPRPAASRPKRAPNPPQRAQVAHGRGGLRQSEHRGHLLVGELLV